jgi:hypothetical protein
LEGLALTNTDWLGPASLASQGSPFRSLPIGQLHKRLRADRTQAPRLIFVGKPLPELKEAAKNYRRRHIA